MKKKSGKSIKAVAPAQPDAVEEADDADPGVVEKVKAKQAEKSDDSFGSQKAKPFKPPSADSESDDQSTAFVELEVLDEAGQPVPSLRYQVKLPDDTVAEGTLDRNGFARIDGIEEGDCEITFPDLDQEAWEPG